MDHQIGAVVNGHVLGVDRAWHPMTYAHVPSTRTSNSYGDRYRARWTWTALVCALLTVLANMTQLAAHSASAGLFDAVLYAAAGALINGSLINIVVAAFPARRSTGGRA